MEALLCLQVFAPYPLHPPLPYPDHTSTATLTPTPTLPSWYHGTIASFIFAIQKSFGIPDSREGASDLESGGTHVHSFSVVPASGGGGKATVCFCQHDGTQHSLVQQAEAQGVGTAGAVTKVEVGGAALAFLHSDEGLDLSVHLELHHGLDQWPGGQQQ